MTKKTVTIRECVEEGFAGSRNGGMFMMLNDDQYVGYVAAMTIANYASRCAMTLKEVIEITKKLLAEGVLH